MMQKRVESKKVPLMGSQMVSFYSLFMAYLHWVFFFAVIQFISTRMFFCTKGFWYGAKLVREENYTIGNVFTVRTNSNFDPFTSIFPNSIPRI